MSSIEQLRERAEREIAEAADSAALERLRVAYLGRRGALTQELRGLGALDAASRPQAGACLHALRAEIEAALEARARTLRGAETDARIARETLDVTLPGRRLPPGHCHPTLETLRAVCDWFAAAGFDEALQSTLPA